MTNPQSGIRIGLSVDSEPVGPPVTPADAPPTAPLRICVDEREVTAAPRIEGDSGIAPRIRRRVHVSKDALLGPVQQPVDHLPATEIVFNIHADTDSSQPNKAARLPLPADYGARGQSVLWIDLKIRPDQFSKDDEQVLINTVARILGIKAASIHVFSVEAGSVRCALWLPVVLDLDMVSEFQAKLARRPDTRRFRPGKCSVSRHSTDHHTILFFFGLTTRSAKNRYRGRIQGHKGRSRQGTLRKRILRSTDSGGSLDRPPGESSAIPARHRTL
jgi:hypothetical protein